ncbi:MAG TPA: SDR family oxidoreductase [Acidimicrobiales bacterium]|nr:SDR family oxidoreductase [Acidimicrobiales bacterium]
MSTAPETGSSGLSGKVAVITGGGTGIGAATARLFAARNAAGVVLAARTPDQLGAVAAEINDASATRAVAVPTDVKDEGSVMTLVARTMEEFGRIDILVNNAGGTRMGPLEDLPTRAWDSIFALNVRGPFIATREVGQHMIRQRSGVIVNVSSGAGVSGVRYGAAYSAAKSALQMFTRVTAAEWGRHGIRANCVAVGLVASERAVDAWAVAGIDPDVLQSGIPLGRVGEPVDVARAIAYLASDESAYVSGETFSVNGGPQMGGPPAQ